MSFDEFWKAYPHRPKCRPKGSAEAYWTGRKPTESGRLIEPDDWPLIVEGAQAYRELAGKDPYRLNAARFLYTGSWEGAIEELAEQKTAVEEMREEDKRRASAMRFNRAYQDWKTKQVRAGNPNRSVEDFKATLQPHLRVVGE